MNVNFREVQTCATCIFKNPGYSNLLCTKHKKHLGSILRDWSCCVCDDYSRDINSIHTKYPCDICYDGNLEQGFSFDDFIINPNCEESFYSYLCQDCYIKLDLII